MAMWSAIPIHIAMANTNSRSHYPLIAIVDFQKVTRESKAGISIREQVNKQHAFFQEEINRLQTELETERQNLQDLQEPKPSEKFKRLRSDYRLKAEKLQKLVQARKRQLDQMFVQGMRQIEKELAQILKVIASERGIDIILNTARGQNVVIFAKPNTLISEEAKSRLNEQLPNISLAVPKIMTKKFSIKNKRHGNRRENNRG